MKPSQQALFLWMVMAILNLNPTLASTSNDGIVQGGVMMDEDAEYEIDVDDQVKTGRNLRGKRNNNHGGSAGDAPLDGEGLDIFSSPGAEQLTNLTGLVDATEYHASRVRGPTEEVLTSPYSENPGEAGENAVGKIENGRRRLNVFLPDTRVEVDETKYPYRAVGRFGGCTATLVYDSGIAVTNAHCLKYKDDGTLDPATWDMSFYAGFSDGTYLASSKPKALWYNKGDDYAVLKLWSNLDAKLGRFGVRWRDIFYFWTQRKVSMISYNGDHCTSWNNCRQKKSSGSTRLTLWTDIFHDLDATRGSSGSAIFMMEGNIPVMNALNYAENRNGGEVSLVLNSYTGFNPNVAKPANVWKAGYLKVKNY